MFLFSHMCTLWTNIFKNGSLKVSAMGQLPFMGSWLSLPMTVLWRLHLRIIDCPTWLVSKWAPGANEGYPSSVSRELLREAGSSCGEELSREAWVRGLSREPREWPLGQVSREGSLLAGWLLLTGTQAGLISARGLPVTGWKPSLARITHCP